jgi:myo-inositol 2-dehydrogenase / D-chiro-inositol 1-dehydrogenase
MSDSKHTGPMPRRRFIASAGAAAALTLLKAGSARAVDANGKLEVGLIGCGGRGQWIAKLFEDNGNAKVVAVHDYFQDRVDAVGEVFGVEAARRYTGLDGYKRLVEGKLDAVAIESPPYFHPEQALAAVEAGKHVYLAKPMAVDVRGCKTILKCGEMARGKLSFLVDFQTRNNAFYREAAKRVHEGAIGEPVCGQCFYHTGRLGARGPSDTPEGRLRNWVFDIALSGDIIVEQNIHVIDVACWLLDAQPLRAFGTGGRRVRTDVGNCWDHFVVTYWFPNDVLIDFSSSQFLRGFHDMCVRVFGSTGTCETHYGGDVWIHDGQPWDGGNTGPIYQEGAVNNIKDFRAGIDRGEYVNTAAESVRSNLAAILGRLAAYRGGTVTWDEMMQADEKLDGKLEGLKA